MKIGKKTRAARRRKVRVEKGGKKIYFICGGPRKLRKKVKKKRTRTVNAEVCLEGGSSRRGRKKVCRPSIAIKGRRQL